MPTVGGSGEESSEAGPLGLLAGGCRLNGLMVFSFALEWPLLGVASVVDLERRMAGECLVADAACSASSDTTQCKWIEGSRWHHGLCNLIHSIAHVLRRCRGEDRQIWKHPKGRTSRNQRIWLTGWTCWRFTGSR